MLRLRDLSLLLVLSIFDSCSNPPATSPTTEVKPIVPESPVSASVPVAASTSDTAAPTDEADVRAILAREQTWRGGAEKLAAIHDLTLAGSVTIDSSQGSIREQGTSTGLWRQVASVGNDFLMTGIDSRGGWSFDAAGIARPVSDRRLGGMRFELAHLLGWHLDAGHGFDPHYIGRTNFDGVACDRVRLVQIIDEGFIDEMIALDGVLLAMSKGKIGSEEWTRYSDWREVNGCRFPFREDIEGSRKYSTIWESIQANQDLVADDFERPDDIDSWRPVLEQDLTIPMNLVMNTFVIVRGEVNGTATDLLVDSGSSYPVLDASFAKSLGLVGAGKFGAHTPGNDVMGEFARDVSISIGPLKMPRQRIGIVDLSRIEQMTGRTCSAIVGVTLFAHLPVTIDYAARHIEFHDPKGFEAAEGSVVVPVRNGDLGLILVEAQLEDLTPALFELDTGDGGCLSINRPYSTANDLLARHSRHVEVPGVGVGGVHLDQAAVFDSFTFAGHAFRDVPCTLATQDGGEGGSTAYAGRIGVGVLSRFVVTFDLPHHRVLLRIRDSSDAPFDKDRLGVYPRVDKGKVFVDSVVKGSPAAAAELVPGLEIVKVDGVAYDASHLIERLRQLKHSPAKTEVRIGLSDGREVVVELADYF